MAKSRKQPVGFSSVFVSSLALLRMKKNVVGVAILCFALLSAIVSTFTGQAVSTLEDRITTDAGISWEQLQVTIDKRLAVFDERDAAVLVRHMTMRDWKETTSPDSQPNDDAFKFIVNVAPWVFLSFLFNMTILFIACVFFLLLAGGSVVSGYEVVCRLPMMTLRMLLLMFWFFVRSFLWIPFVGPLIAFVMVPRLVLAPAILASGSMGIFESLRESMRRTKHHWFRVIASLLGLAVVSAATLFLLIILVSLVSLLSIKLGFLLWLLLFFGTVSFQMFFLMILSERMA